MKITLASIALFAPLVVAATPPAEPPAGIDFGATVATVAAELAGRCDPLERRELDPSVLPIARTSHVQLDCHEFNHAGGPRLAELVFADDALAFVWVLTTAEEESTLRDELAATFGAPSHETPAFIAYVEHRVALRRDKPELLYYGKTVAPLYEAWFNGKMDE